MRMWGGRTDDNGPIDKTQNKLSTKNFTEQIKVSRNILAQV